MSKVTTDINYLPTLSDMGLVNSNLVQINSARSINAGSNSLTEKSDNFLSGVMDFTISMADKQRFSPYRSYFRTEVEVTVKDVPGQFTTAGNYRQPRIEDNFTLAEGFVNNILANSYFYIGSQSVAQQSQYHGQASSLRTRLSRSFNWLRSIGKDVYWNDPDFQSRQKKLVSNPIQNVVQLAQAGMNATNSYEVTGGNTLTFTNTGAIDVPPLESIFQIGDFFVYSGGRHFQILAFTAGGTGASRSMTGTGFTKTIEVIGTEQRKRDAQEKNENSDGKNKIQVCFQPPLSVFSNQQVYPAGTYRVSLFPIG